MEFDINTVRGLITAVLLMAFIGMVFWAYSGKRRQDFAEAADLPLAELTPAEQVENKQ